MQPRLFCLHQELIVCSWLLPMYIAMSTWAPSVMLKVLCSTYGQGVPFSAPYANLNYEWYIKRSCPDHCQRMYMDKYSVLRIASYLASHSNLSKFRNLVYTIRKRMKIMASLPIRKGIHVALFSGTMNRLSCIPSWHFPRISS